MGQAGHTEGRDEAGEQETRSKRDSIESRRSRSRSALERSSPTARVSRSLPGSKVLRTRSPDLLKPIRRAASHFSTRFWRRATRRPRRSMTPAISDSSCGCCSGGGSGASQPERIGTRRRCAPFRLDREGSVRVLDAPRSGHHEGLDAKGRAAFENRVRARYESVPSQEPSTPPPGARESENLRRRLADVLRAVYVAQGDVAKNIALRNERESARRIATRLRRCQHLADAEKRRLAGSSAGLAPAPVNPT